MKSPVIAFDICCKQLTAMYDASWPLTFYSNITDIFDRDTFEEIENMLENDRFILNTIHRTILVDITMKIYEMEETVRTMTNTLLYELNPQDFEIDLFRFREKYENKGRYFEEIYHTINESIIESKEKTSSLLHYQLTLIRDIANNDHKIDDINRKLEELVKNINICNSPFKQSEIVYSSIRTLSNSITNSLHQIVNRLHDKSHKCGNGETTQENHDSFDQLNRALLEHFHHNMKCKFENLKAECV